MSTKEKKEQKPIPQRMGLVDRDNAYKETYRRTGDHYQAGLAYCAGNKWAEENFRALNS